MVGMVGNLFPFEVTTEIFRRRKRAAQRLTQSAEKPASITKATACGQVGFAAACLGLRPHRGRLKKFQARRTGAWLASPPLSGRAGLRYRRCLFPADSYLVWTGPKGARIAHAVTPIAGGPIAFAGLWEHWLGADGSEIDDDFRRHRSERVLQHYRRQRPDLEVPAAVLPGRAGDHDGSAAPGRQRLIRYRRGHKKSRSEERLFRCCERLTARWTSRSTWPCRCCRRLLRR